MSIVESATALSQPNRPLSIGKRASYLSRARFQLESEIRDRLRRQARLDSIEDLQVRRVVAGRLNDEDVRQRESFRVLARVIERHDNLVKRLGYDDALKV
jgi:hypothetical protein